MKSHNLLDVANLNPAEWTLHAGVYLAKDCSEETADFIGMAFDDIAAESRDPNGAVFMAEHERKAVREKLAPWLIDSRFAQRGTCDHCGAWFKFGIVYKHTTGVMTVIGHTCAANSFAVEDRYTLVLNRARKAAQAAAHSAKMKAAALAQAVAGGFEWLYNETHVDRILTDIAAKGRQWGSISPRQIELVTRIHSGAPDQYAIERDRKAAARLAEKAASNYQGEAGKPLTVSFEIITTTSRTYTDVWPERTSYWHLLRTPDGHFMTYRGSTLLGNRGERLTGTFTVKAHEEYQGTKQTVLQRPRKVATVTP